MSPDQYDSLGKSAVATLAFASILWFMDQSSDYFAVAPEAQPLLHTWWLGVEEQFYIVFPLLLMVLATRRR